MQEHFLNPFISQLWGKLRGQAARGPDQVLQRIRLGMLNTLDAHCEKPPIRLDAAIQRAPDIRALWHLRQELMQAIAASKGEAVAQKVLQDVTEQFRGHVTDLPR